MWAGEHGDTECAAVEDLGCPERPMKIKIPTSRKGRETRGTQFRIVKRKSKSPPSREVREKGRAPASSCGQLISLGT
jgi:hypothetical protein